MSASVLDCTSSKQQEQSDSDYTSEDSGTFDTAGHNSIVRPRYFFVLGSEADRSEHDTESILSIQDKSTDWAKDTSDTCTKSLLGSESDHDHVEFEVVSLSDEESFYQFDMAASSSPDDVIPLPEPDSEGKKIQDIGKDSEPVIDSEPNVPRRKKFRCAFENCQRCKLANCNPCFRFCFQCQKLRLEFLPTYTKRKKTPKVDRIEEISGNENQVIEKGQLCPFCKIRAKDGAFLHSLVAHVPACYLCSKKVFKSSKKKCPQCSREARRVAKVIVM